MWMPSYTRVSVYRGVAIHKYIYILVSLYMWCTLICTGLRFYTYVYMYIFLYRYIRINI